MVCIYQPPNVHAQGGGREKDLSLTYLHLSQSINNTSESMYRVWNKLINGRIYEKVLIHHTKIE
jgi:hypothetical protein